MESLAYAFTPEFTARETPCTQLPKRMNCIRFVGLLRNIKQIMSAFPLLHQAERRDYYYYCYYYYYYYYYYCYCYCYCYFCYYYYCYYYYYYFSWSALRGEALRPATPPAFFNRLPLLATPTSFVLLCIVFPHLPGEGC